MADPTPHRSRLGATLVELLVAIAMGVMILAVILLAHHTLTRNARQQLRQLDQNELALRTIALIRDDLQQLFRPVGTSDTAIELINGEKHLLRFTFCRQAGNPERMEFPTGLAERIVYTLDTAEDTPQWIRTTQPLLGPETRHPPTTNRLDHAWPHFFISLYDGKEWQTNWTDAIETTPQAARLTLVHPSPEKIPAHETIIIIPAGLNATSTLVRIGTSAPR